MVKYYIIITYIFLIEILFRDGVPLNEHFLALKTKYQNEKAEFDKIIYVY
jgi:hypothetical protein